MKIEISATINSNSAAHLDVEVSCVKDGVQIENTAEIMKYVSSLVTQYITHLAGEQKPASVILPAAAVPNMRRMN